MAPVKEEKFELDENVPKMLCQMDNHTGECFAKVFPKAFAGVYTKPESQVEVKTRFKFFLKILVKNRCKYFQERPQSKFFWPEIHISKIFDSEILASIHLKMQTFLHLAGWELKFLREVVVFFWLLEPLNE